jgi:hypothetical protein
MRLCENSSPSDDAKNGASAAVVIQTVAKDLWFTAPSHAKAGTAIELLQKSNGSLRAHPGLAVARHAAYGIQPSLLYSYASRIGHLFPAIDLDE